MAYCTYADIEAELGGTFTTAQRTLATDRITAAQAFIDRYCGQTFEASTAITDERHPLYGSEVYLTVAPIASVTTVKVRPSYVGATSTTLTVSTEYSVLDLTRGLLRLAYLYGEGYELLVSYTPAVTVPADIKDVTIQMVAARMRTIVSDDVPGDVKRYSVAGELSVEKFTADELSGQALGILETLKLHRRLVFA